MTAVVAIATNSLGARSETFVRRHVSSVNSGNTVVVCRRVEDISDGARPLLVIGDRGRSLSERATNGLLAVWNQVRWGGIAYPTKALDRSIAGFLKEQQVCAIVAEFGPMGCVMQGAAEVAGIPLYVYFRGRDASSLLSRHGVRDAYGRLFPRVTGVFAVAQFLLDNLAANGFAHPNAHVIPSGVDTESFAPGSKNPHQLLSVGRFVPKKSPDLVIRAFARVASQLPIRLDMIGDGPLLNGCRRLATALGVAGRIRFLGAQPHQIVQKHMSSAGVLLQHSVVGTDGDTEGLPSVIQEGMAAGTVVIATRHAGIPEAITSGTNGLLVDEGDITGFAEAINYTLGQPDDASALAARARSDAQQRFDYRLLIHRLETIILPPSGPLRDAARLS